MEGTIAVIQFLPTVSKMKNSGPRVLRMMMTFFFLSQLYSVLKLLNTQIFKRHSSGSRADQQDLGCTLEVQGLWCIHILFNQNTVHFTCLVFGVQQKHFTRREASVVTNLMNMLSILQSSLSFFVYSRLNFFFHSNHLNSTLSDEAIENLVL
jgi:hypothetical protein